MGQEFSKLGGTGRKKLIEKSVRQYKVFLLSSVFLSPPRKGIRERNKNLNQHHSQRK
jgi:hypothetical protein